MQGQAAQRGRAGSAAAGSPSMRAGWQEPGANPVRPTAAADTPADAASGPADAVVAPPDSSPDGRRDAVAAEGPFQRRQTARPIGTTAAKNGFWEYLPPATATVPRRPLLVFWHGLSGNGNGSLGGAPKVAAYGPPGLIARNQWPANRPFVVLSPQHGPADCPPPEEMLNFFGFAMGSYDIDPGRVYLTGISCGAMGSARYLGQSKGQQVVAAVLISGDASPASARPVAACWTKVALWSFHGDRDSVVDIAGDNEGMNGFLSCPRARKDVRYTVYPGVEHGGAWTRTYRSQRWPRHLCVAAGTAALTINPPWSC